MVGVWAPGPLEIVLIVVALLLLFGAKRLPELARSIGKSSKEFKKGMQEGITPEDELSEDEEEEKEAEKEKEAPASE